MSSRDVGPFRATLDTSSFDAGIQKMLGDLQRLADNLAQVGRKGEGQQLLSVGRSQIRDLQRAQEEVERLRLKLQTLQDLQRQMEEGRAGRRLFSITQTEEQAAATGLGGTSRRVKDRTVENELRRTGIELERNLNIEQAKSIQIADQRADAEARFVAERARLDRINQDVQDLVSGQAEKQSQQERLAFLDQQRRKLEANRATVEAQVAAELGTRVGGRLETEREKIARRLIQARREETTATVELQNARRALSEAKTDDQRVVAQNRVAEAAEREAEALREVASARSRLSERPGAPAARLDQAAVESGAVTELARIEAQLADIQRQTAETLVQDLKQVSPEYGRIVGEVVRLNTELQKASTTDERRVQINEELARLTGQAATELERQAKAGVAIAEDPEAFRERQFAQLRTSERLLVQAFDDIGRRFTATLQFAISGALIYGVQRFVREFAEAALDVERTFADIASALEFDLADEGLTRGSAAFERQVEGFRRGVVELANEFNVLPEIANKTAFVMVSRFQDQENALKATRAQLLATKVATIDQDEALRALTATAEAFANTVLTSSETLSFEERLLQREAAAAENYGKALDEAVLIQQRFGVAVEDTLEGTARAAETFSQLGFTQEETASTIASAVLRLGQTGTNVAERFNRAFSGITTPEIRDQLLEVAAASEAFTLTFADFDSGAQAIRRITEQIGLLQQVEPQTALQLRDILGQRRETEVVAAFFGTADLRRAMENSLAGAAGAAERRFSFLAATTAEQIQSILVQFQEMAQLFERIGGLTPFRAILHGAEAAITGVNELLKVVETLFGLFDVETEKLFGKGLGNALQEILSIALAINLAMTGLSAGAAALRISRASKAGLAAGEAAVASGAGASAAVAATIEAAVLARNMKAVNTNMGPTARAFAQLGTQLKATDGFFRRFQVVLIGLTGTIRAAIVAIQTRLAGFLTKGLGLVGITGRTAAAVASFTSGLLLAGAAIAAIGITIANAAKTGEEAAKGAQTARREARTATEAEGRITPFESREAAAVAEAEKVLNNLTLQMQETTISGWSTGLSQLLPVFNRQLREEMGGFWQALNASAGNIVGPPVPLIPKEEIQGSAEWWWENQIKVARQAFLDAQLAELRKSLADQAGGPVEMPSDFRFDIARPLDVDTLSPTQRAERNLRIAEQALAEAETPEDFDAAQAAVTAATEAFDRIRSTTSEWGEELAATIAQINARINSVADRVAAGQITAGGAPGIIAQAMDDLQANIEELQRAAELGRPGAEEQLESALSDQRSAIVAYVDAVLASFDEEEAAIERIGDPVKQLEARLGLLKRRLEAIRPEMRRTARAIELVREISNTKLDLAKEVAQAAVTAAERKVALAKTTEEWIAAIRELQRLRRELLQVEIDSYNALVRATDPADRKHLPPPPPVDTAAQDENAFREAQEEQQIADRREEDARKALDEASRRAAAVVRLANPIRSRLAQVNAEIAALQVILASGTLAGVELLEAQVRMQELLADRVETQVSNVSAFIRLQAGANDQIKSLQAELTILAKELENAKTLYGEQDAHYSQLALRQEEMRQQLVNAMLSLRDLNRRLRSDITNDFEQAQLDLVAAMEALANAGDLGELERAQLELRKKQAEAAAQKAFFDDRLFQLRFAFETGALSLEGYKAALQRLLEAVDTSTRQGKETFLQIQSIIDGLSNDLGDMQFNVPTEIRLPTLFEVRRALAADQMGVNYMDNRTIEVNVAVSSAVEVEDLFKAIDDAFGDGADYQFRRSTPGGAGIYAGGF